MAAESCWRPGEPIFEGRIDNAGLVIKVRRLGAGYLLEHRGISVEALVLGKRAAELVRRMPRKAASSSARKLVCPMPGLVISIAVGEGQDVKAGEALAVVEAMKMQNVLRAQRDGRVKKLLVGAGDSLAVDAVIMEFE